MQAIYFILFSILFMSSAANAELQFNLPQGVTAVSHDIYHLHMTVIGVCVVIGVLVFGVMIYSMMRYRKSQGVVPATFHEHFWLEVTWTIIPILVLIGLAIPGTRVLIHLNDTAKPDLTIKITGYQWKWQYDYLDQSIRFFSNLSTPANQLSGQVKKNPNYLQEVDHPLVIPIHKKIRFLVTSNDVIHAWWVPDFGVKRDAVPGFINESWARVNRPGTYYGKCVELCGVNHAYMPVVVIAMTQKDFDRWVAQQKGLAAPAAPAQNATAVSKVAAPAGATTTTGAKKSLSDLMKQGEQTYMTTCAACHKPDGTGMPPVFPALTNSAMVKGNLADHMNRVLNGKPGTAMQAFRDQFSDDELAAVITFERNKFGGHPGETVQPDEIKTAKTLPPKG